jgi:hypothetical protein
MPETIDERELWKFAERTAKQVETWPVWKKEGWAVLDKRVAENPYEDYGSDASYNEEWASNNRSNGTNNGFL